MPDIMEQIENQLEERSQFETLWHCTGENTNTEEVLKSHWLFLYRTKEEAEAHAFSTSGKEGWVWDKQPASIQYLKDCMLRARQYGVKGVQVLGYVDGEWKAVKSFPAEEPILGD